MLREAQVQMEIKHPSILALHDFYVEPTSARAPPRFSVSACTVSRAAPELAHATTSSRRCPKKKKKKKLSRQVTLVLELMRGGTLLDAILDRGGFSEDDAKLVFSQARASSRSSTAAGKSVGKKS